jgi:hypothetical protein
MFKGDGDEKLNVEKKESGIRPIDSKRFKSQIEFILEVDKLKQILRRTTLLDRSRQENSAEHSWHLALIVLVLSEYVEADNLNLLRVIKLLLTHDLVEIDAGDTYFTVMMRAASKIRKSAKSELQIESLKFCPRIRPNRFVACGMNMKIGRHLNLDLPTLWIDFSLYFIIILPKAIPGVSMGSKKNRSFPECSRWKKAPPFYGIMSPPLSMMRLRKVFWRSSQSYLKNAFKVSALE